MSVSHRDFLEHCKRVANFVTLCLFFFAKTHDFAYKV